jgi:hypothetical protein
MGPLQDIIIKKVASSANVNSTVIDLRQAIALSFQAIAGTGSCAGTFQLQITNDPCLVPDFNNFVPVNWTNLGTPLTFAQGSTASNQLFAKIDSAYCAMRVVFTDSSSGSNTSLITVQLSVLNIVT